MDLSSLDRALDLTRLQREDHARLDRLMQEYEAGDVASKARAYDEIVSLVTTHAFAEETVVFPAARRLVEGGDGRTSDIEGKHQAVNGLMAELDAHEPGDPAFEAHRAELFEVLRADVREEEDVLLPQLAAAATPWTWRSLGAGWAAARAVAPNRPHPGLPRRPPGNLLGGVPLTITDRLRTLRRRLMS
jgi:hypothetical protein